jgi:hypothetical protein
VLDVGCGVKPDQLFCAQAASYVGVDAHAGRDADLVAAIEAPAHADDPAVAVRELQRVLPPSGRAPASTYGAMLYHLSAGGYWRWAPTGLAVYEREPAWVYVTAPARPPASPSWLAANLLLLAKQTGASRLAEPVIAVPNAVAAAPDRRVPRRREPRPGALIPNLHLTAVKAAAGNRRCARR